MASHKENTQQDQRTSRDYFLFNDAKKQTGWFYSQHTGRSLRLDYYYCKSGSRPESAGFEWCSTRESDRGRGNKGNGVFPTRSRLHSRISLRPHGSGLNSRVTGYWKKWTSLNLIIHSSKVRAEARRVACASRARGALASRPSKVAFELSNRAKDRLDSDKRIEIIRNVFSVTSQGRCRIAFEISSWIEKCRFIARPT